jgi:hypothetical protein
MVDQVEDGRRWDDTVSCHEKKKTQPGYDKARDEAYYGTQATMTAERAKGITSRMNLTGIK